MAQSAYDPFGVNGSTGTGSVVLASSPTLTTASLGSSTATTQTARDNSTKLATTAYVDRLGTFTSYTPQLAQAGNRTSTATYCQYMQIGTSVFGFVSLACTAAGSAGNDITISAPVSADTTGNIQVGSGLFLLGGAVTPYKVIIRLAVSTGLFTGRITNDATTSNSVGTSPSVALASGDIIQFFFMYKAAAAGQT